MTPAETLTLAAYFFVLIILAVYGWHRYYLVYLYMRHRDREPLNELPDVVDVLMRRRRPVPTVVEIYQIFFVARSTPVSERSLRRCRRKRDPSCRWLAIWKRQVPGTWNMGSRMISGVDGPPRARHLSNLGRWLNAGKT